MCLQAGKLELKKRLEGQLSKWAALLQKFLRSTDDQVGSFAPGLVADGEGLYAYHLGPRVGGT